MNRKISGNDIKMKTSPDIAVACLI